MAKGSTLKLQLKHQKLTEEQVETPKKVKQPKVVKKAVVEEAPEIITEQVEEESYKSDTLSKKELRKLKKLKEQLKQDDSDDSEDEDLDLEKLAASESESEIDSEDDDSEDDSEDELAELAEEAAEAEDVEEEVEEEDVPLSDVEIDSDADVVPHTKLTINNTSALKESLARIVLPWEKHAFTEHQTVTSDVRAAEDIKDIYDDTSRELAFYKQGLDAALQARKQLLKLKVPFSRPLDYFAEMVKSDEHMDKLKSKLFEESANKKASEEAKRQRSLKKFGKQVQHATLQDRAKQKKETLEKINSLKKKRSGNDVGNDDDFQIALEDATREERRGDAGGDTKRSRPNTKKLAKESKYGFGGKKAGSRKNDAESSSDVSGFNGSRLKGKQARPGKSKRR